jgi:hypothetical protein
MVFIAKFICYNTAYTILYYILQAYLPSGSWITKFDSHYMLESLFLLEQAMQNEKRRHVYPIQ